MFACRTNRLTHVGFGDHTLRAARGDSSGVRSLINIFNCVLGSLPSPSLSETSYFQQVFGNGQTMPHIR